MNSMQFISSKNSRAGVRYEMNFSPILRTFTSPPGERNQKLNLFNKSEGEVSELHSFPWNNKSKWKNAASESRVDLDEEQR